MEVYSVHSGDWYEDGGDWTLELFSKLEDAVDYCESYMKAYDDFEWKSAIDFDDNNETAAFWSTGDRYIKIQIMHVNDGPKEYC
jgi:hypothetical protein